MAQNKNNRKAAQKQQTQEQQTQQNQQGQAPGKGGMVVCAAHGLNLREGPSTSFAARALLANGAAVEPLELPAEARVPGWTLVRETKSGSTGWVMSEHLAEAP